MRTRGIDLAMPARSLIAEHTLEPESWYGLCPASGQQYPVTTYVAGLLMDQEDALARMRTERDRAAVATTVEHSAAVRPAPRTPTGEHEWFKERGPMTTTAEVLAALSAANHDIAEGMELARQAQEKFEVAAVKLQFVREQTVATFGLPQARGAIQACENAQQLGHVAIEEITAYMAVM